MVPPRTVHATLEVPGVVLCPLARMSSQLHPLAPRPAVRARGPAKTRSACPSREEEVQEAIEVEHKIDADEQLGIEAAYIEESCHLVLKSMCPVTSKQKGRFFFKFCGLLIIN